MAWHLPYPMCTKHANFHRVGPYCNLMKGLLRKYCGELAAGQSEAAL